MAWQVEETMPAYELDDWLAWFELQNIRHEDARKKAEREARAGGR